MPQGDHSSDSSKETGAMRGLAVGKQEEASAAGRTSFCMSGLELYSQLPAALT